MVKFPIPAPQRIPPAVRGTLKIGLAALITALVFLLADGVVRLFSAAGWIADGASLPWTAFEYAVGAIALSYQSTGPRLRRSFRRRSIGTIGGMIIGVACWNLPGGPIASVPVALTLGWAFGVYVDGMDVADKSAFFAVVTVLVPSDNPWASIAARGLGILIGFAVAYLVVAYVWPTDAPEERKSTFRIPLRRG